MKKVKVRKPSKLEELEESTRQSYAHQHTAAVNGRRRLLEFEAEEVDKAIAALTAMLAGHRERRQRIDAMLRGLAAVVEKR